MSKEHVARVPHEGVAPEQARSLRARAWRFVFDCWEQKKAAGEVGGKKHARKEFEDVSRTYIVKYLQEQDCADAVRK